MCLALAPSRGSVTSFFPSRDRQECPWPFGPPNFDEDARNGRAEANKRRASSTERHGRAKKKARIAGRCSSGPREESVD